MKFYITTPIYYVNDKPHIGHAYCTFAADTVARYQRMLGKEVFFLTGTDENASKNAEAAQKAGETDTKDYVDRMSAIWQMTWDELGISNNDFIRTTEQRHIEAVNKFWHEVNKKGDIYKGEYEGLYCVGCEGYKVESDLVDGKCPEHNREPEVLKEENYFFKASKYKEALLKYIEENPDFVQPKSRRQEVVNYITDHLNDISISRPTKGWGIPVPGDESQVIYVWFDALINYLTAVDYGKEDSNFESWWSEVNHLVGKDIIKFHCALWPAMLLSAGVSLPKKVFAHGFFTIEDKKISKSLGNAIDPKDLAETYGVETLKYFLLREIPFGSDGDFSIERISARYDSDLANGLGNFASRVASMAAGRELLVGEDLKQLTEKSWGEYKTAMENYQFSQALEVVWSLLSAGDKLIEETKPWELKKDESRGAELDTILGSLVETLRHVSWMLVPFMPDKSRVIMKGLGWSMEFERSFEEATKWAAQSEKPIVEKLQPLFPRIETEL
jgi:methionyl-tRNA synthetase